MRESSDNDVATVGPAGLVTAVRRGVAIIAASTGDVSGSAETSVPPPIVSVSAGGFHTCSVTVDGWAYCWGENDRGQLGDATNADSNVPVLVSGGLKFSTVG